MPARQRSNRSDSGPPASGLTSIERAVGAFLEDLGWRCGGVVLYSRATGELEMLTLQIDGMPEPRPRECRVEGLPDAGFYTGEFKDDIFFCPDGVIDQYPDCHPSSPVRRIDGRSYLSTVFLDSRSTPIGHVFATDDVGHEMDPTTRALVRRHAQRIEAEVHRWIMKGENARLRDALAESSRFGVLGELIAQLSHELSQPLGAVANYLSVARSRISAADSPAMEPIENADAEIARAADILENLNGLLSRRRRVSSSVDLQDMMDQVLRVLRSEGADEGVSIESEIPSEPGLIIADEVQLQHVILEVVRNAFDSLRESSKVDKRIVIEVNRSPDTVDIQVKDNGMGLPADLADCAFDLFFSTRPGRLGLGLPICRTIVQDHGGRIWIEGSRSGTAVNISLPVQP